MPICLVLHELGLAGPRAEQALFDAVFEVSSSHWRVTAGATLVGQVAVGLALVAALLNAVFAFCLGCEVYLLVRRFIATV